MIGVAGTRGRAIAVAAAAALGVAGLGALTTDLGPWYAALKEPAWKPPDLLFGPAWTLIFACAAAAGVTAWSRRRTTLRHRDSLADRRDREWLLVAFALNATLNLVWSLLFFRLHRPDWAFLEVLALWLSIVLLIVLAGRRSPFAAWLLAPYLAWVSFAALLNHAVVRLNAPFGGS
jgi:tryptophan-rich sensory protein